MRGSRKYLDESYTKLFEVEPTPGNAKRKIIKHKRKINLPKE